MDLKLVVVPDELLSNSRSSREDDDYDLVFPFNSQVAVEPNWEYPMRLLKELIHYRKSDIPDISLSNVDMPRPPADFTLDNAQKREIAVNYLFLLLGPILIYRDKYVERCAVGKNTAHAATLIAADPGQLADEPKYLRFGKPKNDDGSYADNIRVPTNVSAQKILENGIVYIISQNAETRDRKGQNAGYYVVFNGPGENFEPRCGCPHFAQLNENPGTRGRMLCKHIISTVLRLYVMGGQPFPNWVYRNFDLQKVGDTSIDQTLSTLFGFPVNSMGFSDIYTTSQRRRESDTLSHTFGKDNQKYSGILLRNPTLMGYPLNTAALIANNAYGHTRSERAFHLSCYNRFFFAQSDPTTGSRIVYVPVIETRMSNNKSHRPSSKLFYFCHIVILSTKGKLYCTCDLNTRTRKACEHIQSVYYYYTSGTGSMSTDPDNESTAISSILRNSRNALRSQYYNKQRVRAKRSRNRQARDPAVRHWREALSHYPSQVIATRFGSNLRPDEKMFYVSLVDGERIQIKYE